PVVRCPPPPVRRPPAGSAHDPRPSATDDGRRTTDYCTLRFASGKLHVMTLHQLLRELREPNDTKIVLLVADGLGGLPAEPGGKTELETARTPNLDTLVREGVCGLSTPVLPGITPGSGPGHLGLFGYDPL